MTQRLPFGLACCLLAACAAGTRPVSRAEPPPQLGDFPHEAALFALLAAPPAAELVDSLRQLEQRTGMAWADTIADITEETTAHPLLRANALTLLGRLRAPRYLILIQPRLADPDERVRLAAVGAAREFLSTRPEPAMRLLEIATRDSSIAVQARALEAMADRDVDLLRAWLRHGPAPALVPVVREVVAVAEERGAPLVPDPVTGILERRGPDGTTLRFRPVQRWLAWQTAVGRLELMSPRGVASLGEHVEVARDVVPAFFSRDGAFLVYESAREIFVHSRAAASTRSVGPGIAPRALPFTDDFVYVRAVQDSATEQGISVRLQYELVRASFAGTPSAHAGVIASVKAMARFDVAGGASPARWMRIRETADGAGFELVGMGIDPVPLPDLLSAAKVP